MQCPSVLTPGEPNKTHPTGFGIELEEGGGCRTSSDQRRFRSSSWDRERGLRKTLDNVSRLPRWRTRDRSLRIGILSRLREKQRATRMTSKWVDSRCDGDLATHSRVSDGGRNRSICYGLVTRPQRQGAQWVANKRKLSEDR